VKFYLAGGDRMFITLNGKQTEVDNGTTLVGLIQSKVLSRKHSCWVQLWGSSEGKVGQCCFERKRYLEVLRFV